jgi:flagellar hook-associated protein 2
MASISSLGSGSGIDLEGIITKLMSVEQQPLTVLATKEATFQSKLSAFGILKGALSSLQTAAQTLAAKATFTSTAASVTDTSVLSVATGSGAATGNYNISVGQLAQAQVLRSNTNFAATTDTFNTGTIAINVGSAVATNITIDSSNNTLGGIRDAINAAGVGVNATIVNDGTTNRLLLASNTTGLTAGAITVAVTDSGAGGTNALSSLNGSNLVSIQDPLDANLTVNGLNLTRSSNAIADVISGVTLSLTKAGTLLAPISTQLSVSRNTTSTQAAITTFVGGYNAVVAQIKSLSAYNATSKTAAVLTGDGTLRNIQSQLANLIGTSVSGLNGGISRLSDLGISVQKDGTLKIDSTKLSAAVSDSSKDISGLFSSTTSGNQGLAVRFNSLLDNFIGSGGLIASRTDGINSSIKNIGTQRDALNVRLTKIEANYRAQFTALDTSIASMQQTSTYLTQQLDYIKSIATGVSSSKK